MAAEFENGPETRYRELRIDGAGRLAEDLPCRACGYNLRGLARSAACPECESPVERSLRSDLLRFCEPRWLARVARGVRVVIVSILVGIVAGVASIGLVIALPVSRTVGELLPMVVGLGVSLASVVGVRMLTTPDPGAPPSPRAVTVRSVARWCILGQVLAWPFQAAQLGVAPAAAWSPARQALWLAGTGADAAAAVGEGAVLLYLGALARRLPRPRLAATSKIVGWGYLASRLGAAGATMVILVVGPGPGVPAAGPLEALQLVSIVGTCAFGAGFVLFGISGFVLLYIHVAALKRAAAGAAELWSAADAPS